MRLSLRSASGRTSRYFTPALGLLMLASLGCSMQVLPVRPTRYDIEVHMDPESHEMKGQAVIGLVMREDAKPMPSEPGQLRAIEFLLHPELEIQDVQIDGATLKGRTQRSSASPEDKNHAANAPVVHSLLVDQPQEEITITLKYAGTLFQDASAGEEQGQIHNFLMSAHIGTDGIYLDGGGYWHPCVNMPDEADPLLSQAEFQLAAAPIEGYELVAGLERQPESDDGLLQWKSRYTLSNLVLMGGPLKRWTRTHGDITLHAVLAPGKEAVAADVLDFIAEMMDRYQPLLGPYPYKEFTVLEAFFSSGFAFPTCTQLDGGRLTEHKPYRRHGYLDHEMIHAWWGCGVYVDHRYGNWCEALTSFCANYYGYVLDGDEVGARKVRRNQSNFLSSIKPEHDKPLGTYGLPDGVGRGIAYDKGSAFFGMLKRKIGEDAFFAALRQITADHVGLPAHWGHLQEAFESKSGEDLDAFFDQWVRQKGAPTLALTGADWAPGSDELAVWLSQGDTEFELDVPLRLYYGSEHEDTILHLGEQEDRLVIACKKQGLSAIELDPDYRLFRKLKASEVMPTSSLTKRTKKLLIVTPDDTMLDAYKQVADEFEHRVLGDEDHPREGAQVIRVAASEVVSDQLSDHNVLILGEAVRSPVVSEFIAQTDSPVTFNGTGFSVGDTAFAAASQAVYFTVRHPSKAAGGVTVYYGNSEPALGNAGVLSFYPNSLLVFETPEGADGIDEQGMPHATVIKRLDFESHDRIEF